MTSRHAEELGDLETALSAASVEAAEEHFGVRLMRESLERRRQQVLAEAAGVLELSLRGSTDSSTGAEVSLVAQVLESLQQSLASIAQVLTGEPTTRGLIPAAIKDAVALRIAEAVPGSLQLKLVAAAPDDAPEPEQPSLLSEAAEEEAPPLIDQSIDELIGLLTYGDDRESFLQHVAYVGPRATLHVQQLSKVLDEAAASASLSWRSSHTARATTLTREAAKQLTDVLEATEEESREVIYTGRLVGGSLVRRTFELELDGEERSVIAGKVVEEALGDVERLFGQPCTAHMDVREARHSSGETSESHTLKHLAD